MPLLSRRRLALGLGATCALHTLRAHGDGEKPVTLPLSFAMGVENGAPVQTDEWLRAELAEVERLYTPLGLAFRSRPPRPLTRPLVHIETRADRDALAGDWARGVINVFVVASLRDVDDGVTVRRGVHWRQTGHPDKRYVILSAISGASVLAHELGHYFGCGHSSVTDNLMSYDRTGAQVFIDKDQASVIRASARGVVRSGELTPV